MANKIMNISYAREDGEKTYWHDMGILIVKEDGKMSIKLNVMPIGAWNGWLVVSEKKERLLDEAF